QSRVVGVGGGHANGPGEVSQRMVHGVGLSFLNAPLDLAHGVEILADPGAIPWSESAVQAGDVFVEPVEQAGFLPQRGLSFGHAAAFAEKAFENDSRMSLRRQRRGRR